MSSHRVFSIVFCCSVNFGENEKKLWQRHYSIIERRLGGLPKTHKTRTDVKLRPILSTIGTYKYDLSNLFVNLLLDVCSRKYSIKNLFSLALPICNLRNDKYSMASFDIISLFSKILIDDTVEIIPDKWFSCFDTYILFYWNMCFGFTMNFFHIIIEYYYNLILHSNIVMFHNVLLIIKAQRFLI